MNLLFHIEKGYRVVIRLNRNEIEAVGAFTTRFTTGALMQVFVA
jgi:hypothetical protein